ncbi:organic cation transporter protein-like [Penaeus japonicus]|uniref:organic cation transporter protein-like n=1 Tax=Penaeus japonicus TaxID=27405 RepID=UPI001C70E874|nr:organic cation transporter protein-like [Penaeus japonicus]
MQHKDPTLMSVMCQRDKSHDCDVKGRRNMKTHGHSESMLQVCASCVMHFFIPNPKILFWVICLMNVFLVIVYFGQFFMTLTPPHWCAPPSDLASLNLTSEQVKRLTIPKDAHTGKYLECVRYQVDFKQVVESNASWPDPSWPTTGCSHGWNYDFSLYYPTITSELDWVCAEDWKPTLAQSLFFVGSLVGSPVLGWAADAWGRLPIIVATNVVGGLAGVASAFCSSFVSFAVFRFIVGMIYDTHFMVAYILLLEYVSSKYRTIMANVPIMIFLTAAMCAMPWIAMALGHWTFFTIAIYVPLLTCIVFIWIVPESARWLLSQGRVEEAVAILKRAGRINRRPLSDEVVEEFKAYGWKQTEEKEDRKITVTDLLKTPVLRRRFLVLCLMWMVIILAYDAHMRNTEHIGANVFTTFTLAGAVELPADFLTMVAVEKLGRRHTTVWTLVAGGVMCLAIAAVPPDNTSMVLVLAIVGRFLVTMSINVGQQYPVEVLPTVARGSGSGAIHTLGYVAAFISPYVVYLSKYGHFLPYTILGVVTIVGGLVSLLLPETLDQKLPDTLEDGETFFGDQGCCYNPCARLTEEKETEDEPLQMLEEEKEEKNTKAEKTREREEEEVEVGEEEEEDLFIYHPKSQLFLSFFSSFFSISFSLSIAFFFFFCLFLLFSP